MGFFLTCFDSCCSPNCVSLFVRSFHPQVDGPIHLMASLEVIWEAIPRWNCKLNRFLGAVRNWRFVRGQSRSPYSAVINKTLTYPFNGGIGGGIFGLTRVDFGQIWATRCAMAPPAWPAVWPPSFPPSALLDAELLADYLELMGGRQSALVLESAAQEVTHTHQTDTCFPHRHFTATEAELVQHDDFLSQITR